MVFVIGQFLCLHFIYEGADLYGFVLCATNWNGHHHNLVTYLPECWSVVLMLTENCLSHSFSPDSLGSDKILFCGGGRIRIRVYIYIFLIHMISILPSVFLCLEEHCPTP